MDSTAYQRYLATFHARDYDALADFYVDPPRLSFFGVEIRSRQALKEFYGFLHTYVDETVSVLDLAASDTLTAVHAVVRVQAIRDLTAEDLAAHGASGLMPMAKGDVLRMRQFVHYTIEDNRISSVECAMLEMLEPDG